MSNRFSLEPIDERPASTEADAVGAILAESPGWIAPFIVLLDGQDFTRLPSMTPGAAMFEAVTRRDPEAVRLLQAVDAVYAEVQNGYDIAHMLGEMLERYVFHALEKSFSNRLGACMVMVDGEPFSDFRLDAATSTAVPAVGVEAKNSGRAMVARRSQSRLKHAAKAEWVVGLREQTDGEILGVFATWAPEFRFRQILKKLGGTALSANAQVLGHEQLARLPARVGALLGRLSREAR